MIGDQRPNNDHSALAKNVNPGVEYEYVLAAVLMNGVQLDKFSEEVIERHTKAQEIKNTVSQPDAEPIEGLIKFPKEERYVHLPTQDDSTGPSDIVIYSKRADESIGISVKYGNKNLWNPSATHFLTNGELLTLEEVLRSDYVPRCLDDMCHRIGPLQKDQENKVTWRRKRSPVVDEFIDLVRDKVIANWNRKTPEKREDTIKKALSYDNPFKNYFILTIETIDGQKQIKTIEKLIRFPVDGRNARMEKHRTSYVRLSYRGSAFDIQVKFNYGILEYKFDGPEDFCENGVRVKYGNIRSWNFNVKESGHLRKVYP